MSKKIKINQLKAGAIISYLQMAIQILIGLVYTPVMIRLLGQSEFGYIIQLHRQFQCYQC